MAYSRFYTGICVEGLMKITENLSQGRQCAGRDSEHAQPSSTKTSPDRYLVDVTSVWNCDLAYFSKL